MLLLAKVRAEPAQPKLILQASNTNLVAVQSFLARPFRAFTGSQWSIATLKRSVANSLTESSVGITTSAGTGS